MEKTLQIHLDEQSNMYARLLAKYSIEISEGAWYVPGQVALDIVSARITE